MCVQKHFRVSVLSDTVGLTKEYNLWILDTEWWRKIKNVYVKTSTWLITQKQSTSSVDKDLLLFMWLPDG